MVNKRAGFWFAVCNWETMQTRTAPFLNMLGAAGLALSAAILTYAGFEAMFHEPTIAAVTGAIVGGWTIGALNRRAREAQRG